MGSNQDESTKHSKRYSSFFIRSLANELETGSSNNFNVKKFLYNEDLDSLPEIARKNFDQKLESMGWKSRHLTSTMSRTGTRIKRMRIKKNKPTLFLNHALIGVLVYMIISGCAMLYIGIYLITHSTLPYPSRERLQSGIYNLFFGGLTLIHSVVILLEVKACNMAAVKYASILLVCLLFFNTISIISCFLDFSKADSIVERHLWYGLRNTMQGDTFIIDVQKKYLCCGVSNWTDWRFNKDLNPHPKNNHRKIILESSCCWNNPEFSNDCTFAQDYHKKTCKEPLLADVNYILKRLSTFYLLLEFAMIFAISFGLLLAQSYEKVIKSDGQKKYLKFIERLRNN